MADYPIQVQVTIDGKRVYNDSVIVGIFITGKNTFYPIDLTDGVVTTFTSSGVISETPYLIFATKDATTLGSFVDESYSFDEGNIEDWFPSDFNYNTPLDTSKGWKPTVNDYVGLEKSIPSYYISLDSSSSPILINYTGGSSSVDVTYTAKEEFTVTPASPVHVANEDVTLSVTLIDGYLWKDGSQTIVIDGNTITGNVVDNTCTFILNSSNVGSGGNITWNLNYEIYVPPATERTDFFTVYIPTDENMKTINNAIFLKGTDTVDVLHYFSSYKKFFCNIPIEGYKQLKASRYDFGVTAPYTKSYTLDIDCGSIRIDETFNSVLDYAPFSRLTIFLPFIGFQELDVSMVMNNTLHVVYTVDVLSGRCLAKLFVTIGANESCIAEYGGTIASDEVFSNGDQYSGGYELMTSMQLGELTPFILVSTKVPLDSGGTNLDGLPVEEVKRVGDCTGYIKYSFINASGCSGTDAEKTEIENLLKSGINIEVVETPNVDTGN